MKTRLKGKVKVQKNGYLLIRADGDNYQSHVSELPFPLMNVENLFVSFTPVKKDGVMFAKKLQLS